MAEPLLDEDSPYIYDENERLEREAQRWEYVKQIAAREGMSLERAVHYYSIDKKVVRPEETKVDTTIVKKEKRLDKYQALLDWCSEHVFEVVTPQQLVDESGMSYPTIIKFINERMDIFRKVQRGQYEIRDPKADREADKA